MKKINFLSDFSEIHNKTVLLRLDFNVPIIDKIIQDHTRIDLALPFINRLIKKKQKL